MVTTSIIRNFIDAPRETFGGAKVTIREMIARVPFQRCLAGTEDLLKMLMLPTDIVAHLTDGLVAGMLLAVAKAKIYVARIDGMDIRKATPAIYPQRR